MPSWTVYVTETVVKKHLDQIRSVGVGEADKPEENDKPENSERTDLDSLADKEDNEVIMEPAV